MVQVPQTVDDLEIVEDDDATDAFAAYYAEVHTRARTHKHTLAKCCQDSINVH